MLNPENFSIAIFLLPRFLGVIYFFAFVAILLQIKALVGSQGILPLDAYKTFLRKYYGRRCYSKAPMVFWINSSHYALISVAILGVLLSGLLALGFYPPLLLLLLYVLYLSIVTAGQDFLSFGWEGLLLEITINTSLLSLMPTNVMVWLSLNFLLFRFHFQSGAVKLQSADPNWRNLTALAYHYQSQPLPTKLAWYIHQLPIGFHQFSTLLMFFIELVVPFALWGSDFMRLGVCMAFVSLQLFIWLTGNFSFLNHLTIVLSIILVANSYLLDWISLPPTSSYSVVKNVFCTMAGGFLLALQVMNFIHHFFPFQRLGRWIRKFSSYFVANRYGLFAIMTTKRYEVIFEGSEDGIVWKEYHFYFKPSKLNQYPQRVSPFQPRLDWQAWFLPLGKYENEGWFGNFLYHLLKGTPDVLKLIKDSPFPTPPRYVRSQLYHYFFTTFEEKKLTGNWWKRTLIGPYSAIMSLKENQIS